MFSPLGRGEYSYEVELNAFANMLVAPQNQRSEDGGGHALRSGGLLHLEASHTSVSQSGLKTGGGTTVGGARGTIMEVASVSC
jgi:hypothetical protein